MRVRAEGRRKGSIGTRFAEVLEQIESVVGLLKGELEKRNKTMDSITTKEALHSSLTLLLLNSPRDGVLFVYLEGRSVALDRCLHDSLAPSSVLEEDVLNRAVSRLREKYVPMLLEVVSGLGELSAPNLPN